MISRYAQATALTLDYQRRSTRKRKSGTWVLGVIVIAAGLGWNVAKEYRNSRAVVPTTSKGRIISIRCGGISTSKTELQEEERQVMKSISDALVATCFELSHEPTPDQFARSYTMIRNLTDQAERYEEATSALKNHVLTPP